MFFNKINYNGSSHVSKGLALPSLLTARSGNFIFQKISVFSPHDLSFWLWLAVANHALPICRPFLTKTYLSLPITKSSVNFTWFALLSHYKFDKSLLKPGELCLICCHSELPQNKNFNEIRIFFATFPNNAEFTFFWKKFGKKCNLLFQKKNLFICTRKSF